MFGCNSPPALLVEWQPRSFIGYSSNIGVEWIPKQSQLWRRKFSCRFCWGLHLWSSDLKSGDCTGNLLISSLGIALATFWSQVWGLHWRPSDLKSGDCTGDRLITSLGIALATFWSQVWGLHWRPSDHKSGDCTGDCLISSLGIALGTIWSQVRCSTSEPYPCPSSTDCETFLNLPGHQCRMIAGMVWVKGWESIQSRAIERYHIA